MKKSKLLRLALMTMLKPGGHYKLPNYRLPDDIVILPADAPNDQEMWVVTYGRYPKETWLTKTLTWTRAQEWDTHTDWSQDHGFATPEAAFLAWLQWVEINTLVGDKQEDQP